MAAMAVPPALTLLAAAAGAAAGQEHECGERASLHVLVTEESGALVLPGATVVVHWTSDDVLRQVREHAEADGTFSICVPGDARGATVWAEFGDDSSEEAVIDFELGAASEAHLRVLFGEAGPGRIVGRIFDSSTDKSVPLAAVSVAGRPQEVQTDRHGGFALAGVPAGNHRLEVRMLGYAELGIPVTVSRGLTTEVQAGLVPAPLQMEPLVATAVRPRRLEVGGFYERKYYGELLSGGTFFTLEDIDRRRPLRITHMVADAPGIRLRCPGTGARCWVESSRASQGFTPGGCRLRAFIDNSPVDVFDLDTLVLPVEVAGIEVYQGASELPPEFGGYDARCGVVVIWTK